MIDWTVVGSIATVVSCVLALIVLYPAYKELKVSANNSKGEFILNLHQVYTDNYAYSELFEMCWKNHENLISDTELLVFLEKHDRDLLNYLTFFESIYLMMIRKVIEMDILDELFGRRFMIVVNNHTVQNFDLVKNKEYYKNVYLLYYKWRKWRSDNGNSELFFFDKSNYVDLGVASNGFLEN